MTSTFIVAPSQCLTSCSLRRCPYIVSSTIADAAEVQQLRVRLQAAIERHADLPGAREHLWVLDRGFIADGVAPPGREAFGNASRRGRDVIRYEATIEDPQVFTRPWKIRMPLYRRLSRTRSCWISAACRWSKRRCTGTCARSSS